MTAADTLRGAALTPGSARRPARSWTILFSTAGLILTAWSIWGVVRAPGDWVNHAAAAWFLVPVVLLWLVRPGGAAVIRLLAGSRSGRTPG